MAIKVINSILLLFLIQNCKAQNIRADSTAICLNIQFNEYFKNDKVDLAINDSLILKKAILTSNISYGLTDVWINITKKNGKYFISTSQSKAESPINLNTSKIEINLRYHRKHRKFEIKPLNGKYLVFNKDRYGNITCTQTVRKPFFD